MNKTNSVIFLWVIMFGQHNVQVCGDIWILNQTTAFLLLQLLKNKQVEIVEKDPPHSTSGRILFQFFIGV